MEYRIITVKLKWGFKDEVGVLHRDVELIEPLLDHEIKRDNEVNRMRMSDSEDVRLEAESEAVQGILLIKQCCLSFGGIQKPELKHFRSLRASDASKLAQEFRDLKNEEPTEGE